MKTNQEKQTLLKQLSNLPIVQIACDKTGIARATYYRWRKEDRNFAQDADKALQEGATLINDLAESKTISLIKDKQMSAIAFWLRHNHSKYKATLNVSGDIKHTYEKLTKEEEALVRKALILASLTQNHESKRK